MVADRLGAHHAHPSQAGTTSPKSPSRTTSQPKVVIVFCFCLLYLYCRKARGGFLVTSKQRSVTVKGNEKDNSGLQAP